MVVESGGTEAKEVYVDEGRERVEREKGREKGREVRGEIDGERELAFDYAVAAVALAVKVCPPFPPFPLLLHGD